MFQFEIIHNFKRWSTKHEYYYTKCSCNSQGKNMAIDIINTVNCGFKLNYNH